MNKKFLLLLLLIMSNSVYSNYSNIKDTLKVGVYVDNIYEINYLNSNFKTTFYVWFISNKELKTENLNNDITNFLDIDRIVDYKSLLVESYKQNHNNKTKYYYINKVNATILNNMDVSKFPFDIQKLKIYLELNTHYKGEYVVILDRKNSKLKPNFIDKWHVGNVDFKLDSKNWDSNFGDLKNDTYQLDAININIPLIRASWTIYWKLFVVLYISFFLTSLSVFLPNKQSEEKLALIVGSLFTAIGNKYITESYLPISDTFNLSDKLHVITFMFIAFFTIYAIFEQRAKLKDNLKKDYIVFFFSILIYVIIISAITLSYIY
ncbi:hypothetical protein [Flavobacterium ammonificans]|uniref:Uncharacterized protein n=1 Tax=Flavobacterium ammonificans TaxID=1751056 RepID=A0ABN6KVA1_9FLAO|nr:hypothetical protein [Flavobacterium ammonificans]BDB53077.1 hypothetical protein GENT11_13890 [Flavobacterium ammonificans]